MFEYPPASWSVYKFVCMPGQTGQLGIPNYCQLWPEGASALLCLQQHRIVYYCFCCLFLDLDLVRLGEL